jgi:hypothetical protein
MSAICLPKLINQMDGFFGCNVTVEEFTGGVHEFSFKKKTLFDLIKDVFSSANNVKANREATVQALKAVSTHLDPNFKRKLDTLVEKYKSGKVDVDFKEVRNVLKSSLPQDSIRFSPVVYSKHTSVGKGLWRPAEFQTLKTSETSNFLGIRPLASTPATYKSAREEEFEQCTSRWAIVVDADAATDLSEKTSHSKKPEAENIEQSEERNFETIYRQRLSAGISGQSYKIEIFYDEDGAVSDENLAMLAETIVETEKETGEHFSVVIANKDDEEFRKISTRMEFAFLDYIAEHGKARSPVLENDFREIKSEIMHLSSHYQNEHLHSLNTSRW